jgi:hypothetical protein
MIKVSNLLHHFTPVDRAPGTHVTGSWVYPMKVHMLGEDGNVFPHPGIEPKCFGRPANSLVTEQPELPWLQLHYTEQ